MLNHPKKNKITPKVIILGAGLAGMATAEHLIEEGKRKGIKFNIKILEKENYLGGLASSHLINGKYIPKYYHQIFTHDITTKKYLEKFGLLKKMIWKRIKMGICAEKISENKKIAQKKVYNFTDPISLLKFDYLSFWGRIRYGIFGAYVFTLMNPAKIPDSMNAKTWLYKYAGKEVADKLFYQLYARNKFNIPLERISAKQFAFRLKAKEAMGVFGYPVEGLQKFIDEFEKYLKKNNVRILKNTKITKINALTKSFTFDGKQEHYDYLISTIPLPVFLDIVSGLPNDFVKKSSEIEYCPCVCITFGTEDFLSNHYWLNLLNERTHTLFQHSNLFDGYGENNKVNWILRYGGSAADLKLRDAEIRKAYLKDVKDYFPNAKITWSKISREIYAEPVYDKDYVKKMPSLKCPNASNKDNGIYFAGTFVGYPKIRNMNSSLESGNDACGIDFERNNKIIAYLRLR